MTFEVDLKYIFLLARRKFRIDALTDSAFLTPKVHCDQVKQQAYSFVADLKASRIASNPSA